MIRRLTVYSLVGAMMTSAIRTRSLLFFVSNIVLVEKNSVFLATSAPRRNRALWFLVLLIAFIPAGDCH